MATIQKFAWKPTKVWDMRGKDYFYTTIWLSWYWKKNDGAEDTPSGFHMLSDDWNEDTRLWYRNKTKITSNRW